MRRRDKDKDKVFPQKTRGKEHPEKNHPPFRFNGKLSLTGDLPSFRVPYNPAKVNHFLLYFVKKRERGVWRVTLHVSDSTRHFSLVLFLLPHPAAAPHPERKPHPNPKPHPNLTPPPTHSPYQKNAVAFTTPLTNT